MALQVQCMCSTGQGQTLLTAGAESTVTYLSRSQLERKNRTPVTTPSVYALAINGTGPYEGVSSPIKTNSVDCRQFLALPVMKTHLSYDTSMV